MRRRPGFSLIEIVIVAGLVLGLVSGALFYRTTAQHQSLALDFQATSLQSFQLVRRALMRDIANTIPGPLASTFAAPVPTPAVTLRRVPEVPGVPLDPAGDPVTEQVSWLFDPGTHLLYRQGEPLRSAPLESVEFTYFPCRPEDPNPPFGDTLIVRMVAVPVEALGRVGKNTPRAEYTFECHLAQGTTNHLHEEWVGDR